jgi:hypothetical protein
LNIAVEDMQTPIEVKIGQKWSAWVPSRGRWLLTTVVRRSGAVHQKIKDVVVIPVSAMDHNRPARAVTAASQGIYRPYYYAAFVIGADGHKLGPYISVR